MQIYFIDNDDFFTKRKYMLYDHGGHFCEDNDDRTVFFNRGVIETVRKLNWSPDVIQCGGWMTAIMPIFIKRGFKENPLFNESKVVYSIFDDDFKGALKNGFDKKVKLPGITAKDLKYYKEPTYVNLIKAAIDYSDGIIIGSEKINPEVAEYLKSSGKPTLEYQGPENYAEAYNAFYDMILSN